MIHLIEIYPNTGSSYPIFIRFSFLKYPLVRLSLKI